MASLLLISIIALAGQASSVVITDNVCITGDCVQTAGKILSSVDKSVNPCEDFYDYACGRWIKENPIPDNQDAFDVTDPLREKIAQLLRSALEEPVSDMDIEAIRKAKMFYKSCMDTEDINKEGMNWLRGMINNLGGWPVLGDDRNVSLEHTLAQMQVVSNVVFGLIPVGNIEAMEEDIEIIKKVIAIHAPFVSMMSRDNYFDENKRKAFHTNMKKVATLLGGDPEKADKDLYEVLQFETRLVKRVNQFEKELNATIKELTLSELQEKLPQVNWTMYLQEAFQIKDELKELESIYVSSWTIVELGDLLENTDRRLLQNYIIWNFVNIAVEKYIKALEGNQQSGKVRWRECMKYTQQFFQKPLDYIFITREPFEGEEDVAEMFDAIKAAFVNSLGENTWMDEKSRLATREKTLAINAYTAYSKEFYNISEINGEFKGATMSPHNFMENVKALNALGFHNRWQWLKEPDERALKWRSIAAEVTAGYFTSSNNVNIAAGIIKAPYYSQVFPKSMNYGGLGFVLGHELTHSVDNNGRLFDKNGNVVQWWDNATIEAFENRAKCLIDQYSAFKVGHGNDTFVKGEQTLGENISDNGSIRFAFRAYKKWVEKHGEEPRLPGMDLSHDQIFFVNSAMVWCESALPKSVVDQIEADEHSPARARVTVTLRNSVDFATAFKCPLGSPMNPVDKCILW